MSSTMNSPKVLVATYLTRSVFKIPKGVDLHDNTVVKEYNVRRGMLFIEYTDGRTDEIEEEFYDEEKYPDETNIEDAEDWGIDPESESEREECCMFCGDEGDILCYCEGCNKKGCEECVKTYIDRSIGDCKECCKKANFPEGNGWESECESESD